MKKRKGFNWVGVDSSNIDEVGFFSQKKSCDEDSGIVRILFHNGNVYDYNDVPYKEFRLLISSDSVGKYYNTHIKGVYLSSKVESRDSKPFNEYFEDKNENSPSANSITIYEVHEPVFKFTGLEKNKYCGYFMSKEVAEYVVEKYINNIGNKKEKCIREVKVNNNRSVIDYENYQIENIKKTALAKLTEKEKKALGL